MAIAPITHCQQMPQTALPPEILSGNHDTATIRRMAGKQLKICTFKMHQMRTGIQSNITFKIPMSNPKCGF